MCFRIPNLFFINSLLNPLATYIFGLGPGDRLRYNNQYYCHNVLIFLLWAQNFSCTLFALSSPFMWPLWYSIKMELLTLSLSSLSCRALASSITMTVVSGIVTFWSEDVDDKRLRDDSSTPRKTDPGSSFCKMITKGVYNFKFKQPLYHFILNLRSGSI